MSQASALLDALTNAVVESFSTTSHAPTCSLINVAIDFERATDMLIRAQERDDSAAIAFYKTIRQPWLGVLVFGSNFWDPNCKQNSNSVFDSKDSGRIFF